MVFHGLSAKLADQCSFSTLILGVSSRGIEFLLGQASGLGIQRSRLPGDRQALRNKVIF
jgi:hypothetical protein